MDSPGRKRTFRSQQRSFDRPRGTDPGYSTRDKAVKEIRGSDAATVQTRDSA
jgi:hypothetical protein